MVRLTNVIEQLGPYEIIDKVGSGGMGAVYLAVHPDLEKQVAIKVLRPTPHFEAQELARFRREARMAAQLVHPNIVRVWDLGEAHGLAYIVMDYVDGCELGEYMTQQTLDLREKLELLAEVAAAVGFAHRQGIIHRDLNPHNIMLTRDGTPLVTDFGLARPIEDTEQLTLTNTAVGTPKFMAPEQIRSGGTPVGTPVDVYALGSVMYEMLAGHVMNPGEDFHEIFDWTYNRIPPPIEIDGERAPQEVQNIFFKCVEKEPAQRYEDAEALAVDLRRFLDGSPVLAEPPGRLRRLLHVMPAFFRPADRAALLTALLALLPWSAYKLAEATESVDPVLAMQLTCDLLAVVTATVIYLVLRQRRTREAGLDSLRRQLDIANRALKTTQEKQEALAQQARVVRPRLVPAPRTETVGRISLSWRAAEEPFLTGVGVACRSDGAVASLVLIGADRPADWPLALGISDCVGAVTSGAPSPEDTADWVGGLMSNLELGDDRRSHLGLVGVRITGEGAIDIVQLGPGHPVVRDGPEDGPQEVPLEHQGDVLRSRLQLAPGEVLHLLAGPQLPSATSLRRSARLPWIHACESASGGAGLDDRLDAVADRVGQAARRGSDWCVVTVMHSGADSL